MSRDTLNYTRLLRASSDLTLDISRGTLNYVYRDLNRPMLSSYTTPQTPTTSSHLLAQEPVLHQGDWALTASPHPPLQGHPAQLWLLFRPSQTGQNLPTSACKNRTGSNLSFREQHSLYRKRDLTVFWLVGINNKQQNS